MKTDKKVSFVIPCKRGHEKFLKGCIYSIILQDYPNKEIIVVFDGKNPHGVDICKKANVDYIVVDEPKGAPHARNIGFDKSTGDIISFFDADCILVVGALRTWVTTFEDNPEKAFVYGGYRFNIPSYECYYSEEFDEYMLTVNNYIASMFPVKREYVVRWNEDLKSLQDWDFWLRVVREKKGKGRYIRDITIVTEPSEQGSDSITSDGINNWLERLNKVKAVNGIPNREICVASLGAAHQGIIRAKALNADFRYMPSEKPHDYKSILLQGFYSKNVNMMNNHFQIFNNADKKCKKIIQWIGSDVEDLKNLTWKMNRVVVKVLKNKDVITKHICNSYSLKKELGEMGIKASVVHAPLDINKFKIRPLPKEYTCGIYFTDGRPEMYYFKYMLDLAKNTPDIKFLFFGGYGEYFPACNNMRYLGWEKDITKVIDQCSVVLRLTKHDGFPLSPIEFLLSGRQILTNFKDPDFKYVNHIDITPNDNEWVNQKGDIIRMIRMLKSHPLQEKTLIKIRKYYNNLLNPLKYKRKIYEICSKKKNTK